MNVQDFGGIADMLMLAKELKPVAMAFVDVAKEYVPEARQIISDVRQFTVEQRIESFNQYLAAGFSREEAIAMVSVSPGEFTATLKEINKGIATA